MSELVHLEIEERGGVVVVSMAGELDLSGAPAAGARIGDAVPTTARGLVVDFSRLEFIDSSGVAMLFGLARRLAGRRQEMRVVAPVDGAVGRVLEIVEIERAVPVHEDLEQAVADIG